MTSQQIIINPADAWQSTAAMAIAVDARKNACAAYVRGYENDRATASETRQYASCIRYLYQTPVDPDELIVIKVIVVVLFFGTVAGLINNVRNRYLEGIFSAAFVGAGVGFCVTVGVLLAMAGLWFGVQLLMS